MSKKKENFEETELKVSEEIVNEEPRRERKRREAKIVDEPVTEPVEEKKTYTVNVEILNVRLGPGYGFRIEKQILKGQTVTVSRIDNEFGEIEPGLWVAMKFLG